MYLHEEVRHTKVKARIVSAIAGNFLAKGTQQFITSFHVPSHLGLHLQEPLDLYRHAFRNPNSLKSVSKCLKKTNLVRGDVMPKARCVCKSLTVSQAFYFMPRDELKSSL